MDEAQQTAEPGRRACHRILIAGAGVAALEAALALEELAGPAVEMHLIAPTSELVYRPLAVGEPFGKSTATHISIADVLRGRPTRQIVDTLADVVPAEQRIVTGSGLACDYDALLIATGARTREALPGALTFGGPGSVTDYSRLLQALRGGQVRKLVFALPRSVQWGLPLYELALLTAQHLFDRRLAGAELSVVTHETSPLAAFGERGSAALADLLERAGVALEAGDAPCAASERDVVLESGRALDADAVVSLPLHDGPRIAGLPHDDHGFLPVDEHGRVDGVERVWAAGDVTNRPIKQGGLAAQQADAAAESIAEWTGAPVRPSPYKPVLRGVLLTGEDPEYLRADFHPDGRGRFAVREKPLWWPPSKIASRYLAPVLAAHGVGTVKPGERTTTPDG